MEVLYDFSAIFAGDIPIEVPVMVIEYMSPRTPHSERGRMSAPIVGLVGLSRSL